MSREAIPQGLPPSMATAFCQTCNANGRIIVNGKCIVCRNNPHEPADDAGSTETAVVLLLALVVLPVTACASMTHVPLALLVALALAIVGLIPAHKWVSK